ncbi:hypothetical protein VARIO8X_110143 [Burkholderiales bacterium 8X]|nr:hypothetical protein VARIO8X_110143 [Burkholderiales bacterium 8X]
MARSALPRRGGRLDRPDRRPRAGDVQQPGSADALCQHAAPQGVGRHLARALACARQRADHGAIRPGRFPDRFLEWCSCTSRHASPDRCQAFRQLVEDHEDAGRARRFDASGQRADAARAASLRQLHDRRFRALEADREDHQLQAGSVSSREWNATSADLLCSKSVLRPRPKT